MNVLRFAFGVAGLLLMLGAAASVQATNTFNSAYISEFLADNQKGLKDDEGNRSSWIELHNGGQRRVNLSGWFLTDSPTNLTKWRFPGVVLLPEKFMVVFASAKDRTNDLAHLHTNFRLNKQGGYLALVNPATNVVSEFSAAYPKQSADVSFGSVRGEPALRGFFAHPTPGKPNSSSGPGFAAEVIFSKPSGSFTEPFTLALSSTSTGAVIRYTLDGTHADEQCARLRHAVRHHEHSAPSRASVSGWLTARPAAQRGLSQIADERSRFYFHTAGVGHGNFWTKLADLGARLVCSSVAPRTNQRQNLAHESADAHDARRLPCAWFDFVRVSANAFRRRISG